MKTLSLLGRSVLFSNLLLSSLICFSGCGDESKVIYTRPILDREAKEADKQKQAPEVIPPENGKEDPKTPPPSSPKIGANVPKNSTTQPVGVKPLNEAKGALPNDPFVLEGYLKEDRDLFDTTHPYLIKGSLTIVNAAELRIRKGVTVLFTAGAYIAVGQKDAEGKCAEWGNLNIGAENPVPTTVSVHLRPEKQDEYFEGVHFICASDPTKNWVVSTRLEKAGADADATAIRVSPESSLSQVSQLELIRGEGRGIVLFGEIQQIGNITFSGYGRRGLWISPRGLSAIKGTVREIAPEYTQVATEAWNSTAVRINLVEGPLPLDKRIRFDDAGIPYSSNYVISRIFADQGLEDIEIAPGTMIEFSPNEELKIGRVPVSIKGRSDKPIVLKGTSWPELTRLSSQIPTLVETIKSAKSATEILNSLKQLRKILLPGEPNYPIAKKAILDLRETYKEKVQFPASAEEGSEALSILQELDQTESESNERKLTWKGIKIDESFKEKNVEFENTNILNAEIGFCCSQEEVFGIKSLDQITFQNCEKNVCLIFGPRGDLFHLKGSAEKLENLKKGFLNP